MTDDDDDEFDEHAYEATDSMPGAEGAGAGLPKPRSKVVKASPLLPKGPLKRPSFLQGSGGPAVGPVAPSTPDRYAGVSSSSASPGGTYPSDLPVPSEYHSVAVASAVASEPYHEGTGYGYQHTEAADADPAYHQYAAGAHPTAAAAAPVAVPAATTSASAASTAEIDAAWLSAYDGAWVLRVPAE